MCNYVFIFDFISQIASPQPHRSVCLCIRGVMHIFEEQIIWQFQKVFFENLGIRSKPPWPHIFWMKHPREKCQKVDLHYFSTFFNFLKKTTVRASKPPLEWFLEKIEEKQWGSTFWHFSLGCFFQKVCGSRWLGPNPRFSKILFGIV